MQANLIFLKKIIQLQLAKLFNDVSWLIKIKYSCRNKKYNIHLNLIYMVKNETI